MTDVIPVKTGLEQDVVSFSQDDEPSGQNNTVENDNSNNKESGLKSNSLNPESTFPSDTPVQSITFENKDGKQEKEEQNKTENEEDLEARDKLSSLGQSIENGNKLNNEDREATPSFNSKDDALKKYLPYYEEFYSRKEKSVLSMKNYNNDPEGYLQAILDKYTIDHPKDIQKQQSANGKSNDEKKLESGLASEEKEDNKENKDNSNDNYLYPWIEGTLEKLMPIAGVFGRVRYKTRLFRLFDEALVWFEDLNILSKWWHKNELFMRPLGVLPLAMITALRTVDMSKNISDISEDDLLKLELQIGNEGVIVLKCSDYRHRIKWFECLHCAIFSVTKPLFTQKQGIWRINEESVSPESNKFQLTTQSVENKEELNRKLKNIHVRMGTSLVLTVQRMKRQMSQTNVNGLDLDKIDEINNNNDDILDQTEKLDGYNSASDEKNENKKESNKNDNENGNESKEANSPTITNENENENVVIGKNKYLSDSEKETTPLSGLKNGTNGTNGKNGTSSTIELNDMGSNKENNVPSLNRTESSNNSRKNRKIL